MNMNPSATNKNTKKTKIYDQIMTTSTRGYFCFLLLLIVVLFIGIFYRHSDESFNQGSFHSLDDSVIITYENSINKYVTLPCDINIPKGQGYSANSFLPRELGHNDVLFIYSDEQDIRVYIGNQLRREYRGSTYHNNVSIPSGWFTVQLNKSDSARPLKLEIDADSSYYTKGVLHSIYVGDKTAIIYHIFWTQSFWGILGFFIFLLGMILSVLFLIYRKDSFIKRYIYMGISMIFLGSWIFFSNNGRQLFLNEISVSQYVGLLSANLAIFPFILFMSTGKSGKYLLVHKILWYLSLINLGFFSLLIAFHVTTPGVLYRADRLCFIVLGILMLYDTIKDYNNQKNATDTATLKSRTPAMYKIGLGAILSGGTIDIILILFNKGLEYRIPFTIGTVIFSVCCLISFLQEMRRIHLENLNLHEVNEEKSRFLAKMSHAIRTPVNSVLGMNSLILRENNDQVIREYATDIERAGNSLISTIDDILDASTVNSNSMKLSPIRYQISSLVNDCRSMMYLKAEDKHLKFMINMNPDIPGGLIGDEFRLREIVLNLLSNAIKYTKNGSVFFICDFERIDEKHINLIISVRDTGIGIRSDNIKSLFSNYQRLNNFQNRNIEGTGLGLVITKNLVEKMKGTIDVSSVYGSGSTFTVTIPQDVYDNGPSGPLKNVYKRLNNVARDDRWFKSPHAKILVVDDVAMNRKVIMKLMSPSNMRIDSAENGIMALEMIKSNTYDLIFLDHMMPEMDGIETLQHIKEIGLTEVPVIMLTANAVPGIKDIYLESGFTDYLAKPVTEDALIQCCLKHIKPALIEKWPDMSLIVSNKTINDQEI